MAIRRGRRLTPGRSLGAAATGMVLVFGGFFAVRAVTHDDGPPGVKAPAQTFTDLAYAGTSPSQKLDLYLPKRTGEPIPLVVNIHGGAFRFGDKKDETGNVKPLLAKGFAVASLNYRLSGEAQFPAGVQDVKAAVRWLRANSATYGIHPQKFAAWGSSAGGHLSAMLGVTGSGPSPFDAPELGNPEVSSAVQAVVDWFGPTDFLTMDGQQHEAQHRGQGCAGNFDVHDAPDSPESLWLGAPIQQIADRVREASPISYVAGAAAVPPFYIAHGTGDCTVAYGQSEQLEAALKQAGRQVELHPVERAVHADVRIYQTQTAPSVDFVVRVLG